MQLTIRVPTGRRPTPWRLLTAAAVGATASAAAGQQVPITGETFDHDPSTIAVDGGTDYLYSTGAGILSRQSTNLSHWTDGPAVFSGTGPSWTTADVPGFTGTFWAPEVSYFGGLYHMYYAVSTFGSQTSAIGLATSPTLNPSSANYGWTDQGPVVRSNGSSAFNAIDPSILTTPGGAMWMTFGSYWTGIYEAQVNPATGTLLNPGSAPIHLAQRSGSDTSIEASYLYYKAGYYYLFDNWGSCCQGISSTYNVRVGRSTSPTGPFVDASGVAMLSGGGTSFLSAAGNYIGPGQVGIYSQSGQDYVGYHYYNGANNGVAAYALQDLYWTPDGWPTTLQPLTWNATAAGTSAHDGGGAWNLTGNTFFNGSANQAWNNSGYGAVTFGANGGAAGTVTLGQDTTAAAVTFNAATSGTYTLAGGGHTLTLTLGSGTGGTITANVPATVNATVTSTTPVTKLGPATVTFTGPVNTGGLLVRAGTVALTNSAALTTAAGTTSTADRYASIGTAAGETAALSATGAATFTVAGDLNVGDVAATGVMTVGGSAVVSARTLFVGKYATASGTVVQTGGTVQEADNGVGPGEWRIGGGGSTSDAAAVGAYNLSGGTLSAGNVNLQVGAYGHGTLTETGGAVTVGGYLSIGRFAGGVGTVNASGGSLTAVAQPDLIVGEQGNGTLIVGGSAAVNAATLAVSFNGGAGTVIQTGGTVTPMAGVLLGRVAGGTGTYALAGGTLVTPSVTGGAGAGTFSFAGGTLRAAADSATFVQGLTSATVTVGGAVVDTAGHAVTVAQPLLHNAALTGADGGLTKLGTGTLTLSGLETYTGPTNVSAGVLTFAAGPVGGGYRRQLLPGGLAVAAGASATLAPTVARADRTLLVPTGLSIAGRFDLANNDLDVVGGSLPAITALAATGFAGGAWNGVGLDSSTAAADGAHLSAVGVIANTVNGTSPLYGSFDGRPAAATDVLARYTYYGDANLDGVVNAADYTRLDAGFITGATGWLNGDFNYDGVVDGSDYTLADNGFNRQSGSIAAPAAAVAAVPEPTGLGPLALGAMAALAGRRRRASKARV